MAFDTVIPYKNIPAFHFAKVVKRDFHQKKIKGIIFGNFGAFNYGDEALLAGQLQELRTIKNCDITVISRFPEQITKTHKTKAISTIDLGKILPEIAGADFIIVGGGGLFCKNDGGLKGFLFQLYTAAIFLLYPQLLHKKTYVLGIGVYNNMPKLLQPFVLQILKQVSIVTVRDAYSYEFLKANKIPVVFFKDNSFLMDLLPRKNIAQDTFFKENIGTKKYNVAFALKRPDSYEKERKLIKEITTFMKENTHDTAFWFYSLDANTGYNNDKEFNDKIIATVKQNSNNRYTIFTIPTNWHPNTLFASFQLMDYMVAIRLHASIFCYRINISFYGITYDTKCSSFLDSIGHTKHEISEVSAKEIQEEFEKVKNTKKIL